MGPRTERSGRAPPPSLFAEGGGGGGASRASHVVPARSASWHDGGRSARLSAALNVHRPEKLDSGFFTSVVVEAFVPQVAIEVLRAVAAHRAAVPVRAGPCISDTMSLRAACSLLTHFVAVGAVRHPLSFSSFVRSPLGRHSGPRSVLPATRRACRRRRAAPCPRSPRSQSGPGWCPRH